MAKCAHMVLGLLMINNKIAPSAQSVPRCILNNITQLLYLRPVRRVYPDVSRAEYTFIMYRLYIIYLCSHHVAITYVGALH